MTEQQVSLDHAAKSGGPAVGEGHPDVCSACEISRAPDAPGGISQRLRQYLS